MQRIVFVCAGNICRSPTAERVFRLRAPRVGLTLPSMSCGLVAQGNESPVDDTVRAAFALGVDLANHRSRRFTPDLLAAGDLVLVMERNQRETILTHRIDAIEIALLGGYARVGPDEIDDPGDRPWSEFERCMREIGAAVDGLIESLLKRTG